MIKKYDRLGKNKNESNGDYIVFLPETINLPNYNGERIAETRAVSERKAVSNVLFRRNNGLNDIGAKIIMSVLDNKFGGVEKYAVLIPEAEVLDENLEKIDETGSIYTDYLIAMELAAKNNSQNPEKYVDEARSLLRGVGRLPPKGNGWH